MIEFFLVTFCYFLKIYFFIFKSTKIHLKTIIYFHISDFYLLPKLNYEVVTFSLLLFLTNN